MCVTLMAFGRRGYAHATDGMVASLRHYGYKGPIHIHATGDMQGRLLPSTVAESTLHLLPDKDVTSPGLAKVTLPFYLDYGPTLYLDIDGIALKNIDPLLRELMEDGRSYITQVVDRADVASGSKPDYFIWADKDEVITRHGLEEHHILFSPQTSWAFFRPGPDLDRFTNVLQAVWNQWSVNDIKHKWGKSVPDELIYGIACSLCEIDPSWPGTPVHLGKGRQRMPEIVEHYYVLGMYGSGKNTSTVPQRFRDMYDAVIRQVVKGGGDKGLKSASYLMRDKYVDQN